MFFVVRMGSFVYRAGGVGSKVIVFWFFSGRRRSI